METLDPNLSAIILSYLDDNSLKALNVLFPVTINLSKNTNTYWHQKTELLLGKQFDIGTYNWKQIYNILSSDIEDKWMDIAIYYDSLDTVKFLTILDKNKYYDNETLAIATEYDKIDILQFLLKDKKSDKNPYIINVALISAIEVGNIDTVKILLQKQLDINSPDEIILSTAVNYGQTDILRILLKDGRLQPNKDKYHIIGVACHRGNSEIVKLLLDDGRANPAYLSNIGIITAAEEGYTDIIKLLLSDPRVNPGDKDNEALIKSVINNHVDIVNLLINNPHVNPIARSNMAYNLSIEKNNKKMIEVLLKNDIVLNNINQIPIIYKDIIKDSLKGMMIGDYFRRKNITSDYSNSSTKIENIFYYNLLRYIIIRKPTMIQIIQYITHLTLNEKYNKLKKLISIVANNTVKNIAYPDLKNLGPENMDLYQILSTFFLCIYEPKYSYNQLLELIDYKNYNFVTWKKFSVMLIGAFIGFDEILKQNYNIKDNLIRFSNSITRLEELP
jgi:hypothetical protein